MKKSIYFSLGLLFLVTIWMLSGVFAKPAAIDAATDAPHHAATKMTVGTMAIESTNIAREITLQGELEPFRQVDIRAQTSSQVTAVLIEKGQQIAENTLLVKLADEGRTAQFKSAQAEVDSQQLEVAGAKTLLQRGLQSKTNLKVSEAKLAAAEAALEVARLELDYIAIKAPFSGILEDRHVELGSHLEKGDSVALIIDESILKAVGYVSQQNAVNVHLGQQANILLLDGRKAKGTVSYISRVGDEQTHSFRVEAEITNTDNKLNAGVSVTLSIITGQETAHFVSAAVLSLDTHGGIGIKSVDDDGTVAFYSVKLLRTEAEGIWVSGLPTKIRIITEGQGFVVAGESVTVAPAS